jgi:hypothetical protein
MTNSELIKMLQGYDPDAVVIITLAKRGHNDDTEYQNISYKITDVTSDGDNNNLTEIFTRIN